LTLCAGDVAASRSACCERLMRFGKADSPDLAARLAQTCLLAPGAVPDLGPVQKLAGLALKGTEKHPSYRSYLLTQVLADHRAGQHADAVRGLKRVAPKADGGGFDARAFAVLARAGHGRGEAEEARGALAKAQAIVAKKMPDPAKGKPFGADWPAWLRCQILCAEAEGLLKKAV